MSQQVLLVCLFVFFKSATTDANTILAASTPSPSQAPLTSFITRSLVALYLTNGLSDQIKSKTSVPNS